MADHAEGPSRGREAIFGSHPRQRASLMFILLALAIALVVGTQNFDERASVHFLLWSFDLPLLIFFLGSVSLGVLSAELARLRSRRRRPAVPRPGSRTLP